MTKQDLLGLWRDKANWGFGYIYYYCKEDPRILVPKANPSGIPKLRYGATFNFAHPQAYLAVIGLAVISAGPYLFMVSNDIGTNRTKVIALTLSILTAIGLAMYQTFRALR